MTVFRLLAGLALLAFSSGAFAQTSSPPKAYTSPTTIVVSTVGSSVIEVQATGTASGLNFSVQGMPFASGSSTWVPLAMVVPSTCASVTSSTANGDWLISTAGFTSVRVNLVNVIGSETIGINSSPSSNVLNNCSAQAAAGGATATNQTNVQANPGSDASKVVAVQGVTGAKPVGVLGTYGTSHPLDSVILSGSGPTTVLTAGHALYGGVVTPSVAYCINVTGAAAGTANSTDGTECYAANQPYYLAPTGFAISVNATVAGAVAGHGQY